jgi:hypothetical protein
MIGISTSGRVVREIAEFAGSRDACGHKSPQLRLGTAARPGQAVFPHDKGGGPGEAGAPTRLIMG